MKQSTYDLAGHALDWAVTTLEEPNKLHSDVKLWLDRRNNETIDGFFMYRYSVVWAQGGEIIEREKIELHCWDFHSMPWKAVMRWDDKNSSAEIQAYGTTPLVAAMRCYVASKLGNEVEIPAELTQGEDK